MAILNGQVFWTLGLIAASVGLIGNYVGAGLAIRNGSKIVRPVVVLVLILLAIKVLSGLI